MTLLTSSAYSSFDQTANLNKLDISPFLSEALIYDYHLLGVIGMPMDNPLIDTTYTWWEDSLNSDLLTPTISLGTADTSITITASTAPHVGDLVFSTNGNNNQEIMQITAVNSSTNITVSRGYNATTAASVATTSSLALVRLEQEFSDITTDATVNPTGRTSYTAIQPGRDLQISGSQLARTMATGAMADQVAHQLQNRLKEWKRDFTRKLLYAESFGPGSDTQYRSFGGARYWIKGFSGQTYTTAGAFAMTQLNSKNKSIVDLGDYPDTLVIGTDLVGSVNGIEATNRQLLESDRKVGYFNSQIVLGQGNTVDVVVDGRVNTGDAFLLCRDKIRPRPLQGRALFTLAGQDWVDGVKRRILGEWGLEFRQPSTHAYFSAQT